MHHGIWERIHNRLHRDKQRILIIDDEEAVRKLFSSFFTLRHYSVTTAAALAEAEAKLTGESFDIVLLDVLLPDGDGVDFVPRIKQLRPGIPVIVLSGLGYDDKVVKDALKKHADSYVSKLGPLDQILVEVHRLLKLREDPLRSAPEQTVPDLPLHILHVEDDANDAELIRIELQCSGLPCKITRITKRDQFEAAFEGEPVDLIISDSKVPGFNTTEVASLVHARKPHIPVVFLTGNESPAFKRDALCAGAADCLLKHDLQPLFKLLKNLLSEKQNRASKSSSSKQ